MSEMEEADLCCDAAEWLDCECEDAEFDSEVTACTCPISVTLESGKELTV